MLGLRHVPLKYRLPLIHGSLNLLGKWRAKTWNKAGSGASDDEGLKPGGLVVSAFFNESLGVGRAGRLSADAFKAAGYHVVEHDLRPGFKLIAQQKAQLPESGGGVWFIHANAPEVLVAFLAHPPQSWANMYRIAYWAWETSKAPLSWIAMADYLHEIWVPSHFVHDALSFTFTAGGRADLIPRLRVMPHPLPVTPPPPPDRHAYIRDRFGLRADLCEVLCLFDTKSSAVRKNPWGVLEAWERAFPAASATARLTLKVSDLGSDPATAARLTDQIAGRSDIRLMDDRLSDADMMTFIGAFDVLVSLHRGEGFGLTLAEAMAAGVVVMATGWSGNLDFMTEDNSRLIPAHLVPVRDIEGPYTGLETDPDQVWAEPELWPAMRALRELAESKSLRDRLGHAGIKAIRELEKPWQRSNLAGLPFNRYL